MRLRIALLLIISASIEAEVLRNRTVQHPIIKNDTEINKMADISYGNDKKQRLDLYLPPCPEKAPIIVMVHGGAWKAGDKKSDNVVGNKMHYWVGKGAIFVSLNYRLVPGTSVGGQIEDVANALAYVQRHGAQWGGDVSRIVLMGHSAGAHLVSVLSADPSRYPAVKRWLGTVSLDTATMDLSLTMAKEHQGFYDEAFGSDPAMWEAYSPYYRINRSMVPMLAVCSSVREDKPCGENERFAQKARAMGIRVEVSEQPLEHGAINDALGKPGSYTQRVETFIDSLGDGL